MVRCAPSGWPTRCESWDTKHTHESGQTLQQHEGWLSAAGAVPSNTWRQKYFRLQQKEKNQELRIEKIRGTVNPVDVIMKLLDGKCLVMLCELLNIKHISGRPSSAPKLTLDTEYHLLDSTKPTEPRKG